MDRPNSPCLYHDEREWLISVEGNLVGGVKDNEVKKITWPFMLNSEVDSQKLVALMCTMRLLNKSSRKVIDDTNSWLEHVWFMLGFHFPNNEQSIKLLFHSKEEFIKLI
jgi:hypothetical protein